MRVTVAVAAVAEDRDDAAAGRQRRRVAGRARDVEGGRTADEEPFLAHEPVRHLDHRAIVDADGVVDPARL